jgi:predicted esterase
MPAPALTRRDVDGRPSGVVLMLHGGKADGLTPIDERSTSWRRSSWMMSHIGARLNRGGASVWLLRYQLRGWNAMVASPPSPVPDALWALDEVRRELGELPVVLLGHSMGARTAVAVADDPSVAGVVALAPWLPAKEPVRTLAGKHLAAAHGSSDKITSAKQTQEFVRRAGSVAASTEFHDMGRAGHYMFRRIGGWNDFAVSRSLAFLQQHAER